MQPGLLHQLELADIRDSAESTIVAARGEQPAELLFKNAKLVNEELARYEVVTIADVQRVAKKYFTKENRSVIYMLPESMRPKAATSGK